MRRLTIWIMASVALASLIFASCGEDDDFIYDPDAPSGDLTISNLEVSSLPNMSLGAQVSFTTSGFARSWVEFCADADCWTTDIDNAAADADTFQTEHEVLVIGMCPDADYVLTAVAEDEDGNQARSDAHDFQTGSLPYELDLEFQWERYDPDQADPDWILADLAYSDWHGPNVPVVFNEHGVPVWYADPWPGKDGDIAHQATLFEGNILIGGGIPEGQRPVMVDLAGNIVWEAAFIQANGMFSAGTMHHQFHPTPDGQVVTLVMSGNSNDDTDILVAFDPDEVARSTFDYSTIMATEEEDCCTLDQFENATEWFWVGYEHYTEEMVNSYGNSVHVYPDEGEVLYHGRERSMLFCIDQATGDIKWRFGQDSHPDTSHIIGDFTIADGSLFPREAHGVKRTEEGTLLFYDNGYGDDDNRHVRLVEFALDFDNMTAEVAWQWPNDNDPDSWWNSGIGGNILPLDNGNFLVFSGMDLEPQPHRIFEVTRSGDIVWELYINGGHERGVYSGEKIPALALPIQ